MFVDEYQDVDEQQYRLLRQLAAPTSRICVIGDPDQAIYGFRGGDVGYFLRFRSDYPGAAAVRLSRSYRSAPTIVRAAMQLIRPGTLVPGRELVPARTDIPDGPVALRAAADERDEAEAVAAEIEKLLGGASFHALDSRAVDGRDRTRAPAVVRRLRRALPDPAQAAAVGEALARRGFPFQRRSHARLADMPGVPEILAALSTPVLDSAAVPVAGRLAEAVRLALTPLLDGPARTLMPNAPAPNRSRRCGPPPTCSPRSRPAAAPTSTGSSTNSRSAPRSIPGTREPTGSRCSRCTPPRALSSPSCSSSAATTGCCRCAPGAAPRSTTRKSAACSSSA